MNKEFPLISKLNCSKKKEARHGKGAPLWGGEENTATATAVSPDGKYVKGECRKDSGIRAAIPARQSSLARRVSPVLILMTGTCSV